MIKWVFLLIQIYLFTVKITNLQKLLGILKAPPQSIQEITHENYLLLKKESAIDERFTID